MHRNPERKSKRTKNFPCCWSRQARSFGPYRREDGAQRGAAAHTRSSDQLPPTLLEQPRTLRRALTGKAASSSSNQTSCSQTSCFSQLQPTKLQHKLPGSVVSLTCQAPPPGTASFSAGTSLQGMSPPSPPIGRAGPPPARLSDRSGNSHIRLEKSALSLSSALHPARKSRHYLCPALYRGGLTLLLTIRRFGGKPRRFSILPAVEEPCPHGIVGYGGEAVTVWWFGGETMAPGGCWSCLVRK